MEKNSNFQVGYKTPTVWEGSRKVITEVQCASSLTLHLICEATCCVGSNYLMLYRIVLLCTCSNHKSRCTLLSLPILHYKLARKMKLVTWSFQQSRSPPDFKLCTMTKRVSVITVLIYAYVKAYMHTDIFTYVCLNGSLGFRHKLILVQQLPEVVNIDWMQVLGLIKDVSNIII